MIRFFCAATVLMAGSVKAADFRDCREWFIYPTASETPGTKRDGRPWDADSLPDTEIRAKVAGRNDLLPQVIGPKAQDAASLLTWNPLWPAESHNGRWLPVRIGDSLELTILDRDVLDDDLMAAFAFELPKELAGGGFGAFTVTSGTARVGVVVSATDGQRMCAGVEGEPSLVHLRPPQNFMARPDAEAFAAIAAHNKCNVNPGSRACTAASYSAIYTDLDKDQTTDLLITGGPFARGTKTKIVALWLGAMPADRRQVFVGDCDDLGTLSTTEFTCTTGGKVMVVSYSGKGGVREATALETERGQLATTESRMIEAKVNLKSLHTAQRSFFFEKGRYSINLRELKFEPARGNLYAYFATARGAIQNRKAAALPPMPAFAIISPDQHAHPGIAVPTGLREAGCPLTFGTSEDGEPIGLGITGAGPTQQFIGYAIGNIDQDPDFDCWSIATFERRTPDGKTIPAGEPWHEKSDLGMSREVPLVSARFAKGKPDRTVEGIISQASAGDLGCYIKLKSADGKTHQVMGDFELCGSEGGGGESFVGQKVSVEIHMLKVEMCEGATGCGVYEDRPTVTKLSRVP